MRATSPAYWDSLLAAVDLVCLCHQPLNVIFGFVYLQQTIVTAMSNLTPPVQLACPENQHRIEYVFNLVSQKDFEFPSVSSKSDFTNVFDQTQKYHYLHTNKKELHLPLKHLICIFVSVVLLFADL